MSGMKLEHDVWDDTILIDQYNKSMLKVQAAIEERLKLENGEFQQVTKQIRNDKSQEKSIDLTDNNTSAEGTDQFVDGNASERNQIETNEMNSCQSDKIRNVTKAQTSTVPPLPKAAVHDEALRNMLISWYQAGYHAGYYDGTNKL